jgi:hypothetical protein
VKAFDLIKELLPILLVLRAREEDGTSGVAVECVDIRRNTDSEGSLLECA